MESSPPSYPTGIQVKYNLTTTTNNLPFTPGYIKIPDFIYPVRYCYGGYTDWQEYKTAVNGSLIDGYIELIYPQTPNAHTIYFVIPSKHTVYEKDINCSLDFGKILDNRQGIPPPNITNWTGLFNIFPGSKFLLQSAFRKP